MKIVFLHSHFLYYGGPARFYYEVLSRMKKEAEVKIIVQKASQEIKNRFKEFELVETGYPVSSQAMHWLLLPAVIKKMSERIKKEIDDEDILIPHIFPLTCAIQNLKNPKIWYCHEPFRFLYDSIQIKSLGWRGAGFFLFGRFFQHLDKKGVAAINKILCNSSFTSEQIRGIYRRDAEVVSPGVDIEKFKPAGIEADERYIFTLNKLYPTKGVDLLIYAFKKLIEENEEIFLYIGGEGEDRRRLENIVKDLNLEEKVIFLGFVPEDKFIEYYQKSLFVVYPAIMEPFGMVPLEAMACGKPVVACKGGGPEETIIDGVTGYLVNPEIDEVANAMTKLMENEEGRNSMGKNAREHVKVNYTWDRTVEGILNALT